MKKIDPNFFPNVSDCNAFLCLTRNKASNTLDAFHGGQSVGPTTLSSGTNYSTLYSGDHFTVRGKLMLLPWGLFREALDEHMGEVGPLTNPTSPFLAI